ncbi:hypothetical protein [Helicobacter sp. 23-1045]
MTKFNAESTLILPFLSKHKAKNLYFRFCVFVRFAESTLDSANFNKILRISRDFHAHLDSHNHAKTRFFSISTNFGNSAPMATLFSKL